MAVSGPSSSKQGSVSPPENIMEERFSRSRYEPVSRFAHSTIVVKDKLYLWGGWQRGFPAVHSSPEKTDRCLKMDVMDLNKGEWSQLDTYGQPHQGVRGYATATIDYNLYYFGGYCGHEYCRHNTLKCLDTTTMEWKDIPCSNPQRSPMKKNACGMVAFKDNGRDYLFVCGGAGMLCSANDPKAIYMPFKGNPDNGWTNEVHIYDLTTGDWTSPDVTGEKPPPSAGFTLTQISPNTAVFIGGIDPFTEECISDVYKVELKADSVRWTQIKITTPTDARPRARHDHSAVCVSDITTEPCIMIAGGRDVRWRSLDDVWILSCESGQWRKLDVPEGVACRQYHSLSLFNINSSCGYAVMFGGVKEWMKETSIDEQPMLADTTVIELVRSDEGVWSVSAVLDSVMLSTTEEYKSRMIQSLFNILGKNFVKNFKGSKKKSSSALDPNFVYQQTISDLQQQILSKDVKVNDLEAEIKELTQQLAAAKAENTKPQQEQPAIPNQVQESSSATPPKASPRPPQSQLSSAVSRAITAEQLALECTEDVIKPYLVMASDVEISGSPIHKGAYGHTVVGKYRGTNVGARTLQQAPSSAFSKMVLMRELMKASQAIHPNIHLFLGAVVDSDVVIINESMPTNLRYELEKKAFTKQDILHIAGDLSRGITFLHQVKPRPIIHRGIYTQAIHLERLAFRWRAKLSDTILPNYFHFTTEGPPIMDPAYCPPEANEPAQHTPKYDIFSLGVVLMETNCRKIPPNTAEEREKLLQGIKWSAMVSLIGDCLAEEPSARPSADRIIGALEQIQTK